MVKVGNEITRLLPGTEVTVSGEGAFRKLKRVNQYIHFPSLRASPEPQARDHIVVLEKPVPINAGDLIGYVDLYQEGKAEHPERKLHLEVFSADDLPAFLNTSRAWAKKLPAFFMRATGRFDDMREVSGSTEDGRLHHLHPAGLVERFQIKTQRINVELLEKVTGKSGAWFTGRSGGARFAAEFERTCPNVFRCDKYQSVLLNNALERYGRSTAYQQAHFWLNASMNLLPSILLSSLLPGLPTILVYTGMPFQMEIPTSVMALNTKVKA